MLRAGRHDRVQLRRAQPGDIPLLEHWDAQPHVIAASGDDDAADWADELARQDDVQEVLIAEVDGRPVGVLQIIDPALEATHYWGDIEPNLRAIDIWIGEAADLGHGHGTLMMTEALDRCFGAPEVTAVVIDPLTGNTDAHRFYAHLGFVPVERRTFGTDDCLVHRLERAGWERRSHR
jgi:aminoglycoside 6'-N-acetyltransferase